MDWRELLGRAKAIGRAAAAAGPPEAALPKPGFAEEALPCMPAVYRFSIRLTRGDEEEAQELVQETFLRAYRAWESYAPRTRCLSWLFTICRHEAIRRAESLGRRPDLAASDLGAADVEALAATSIFAEVRSRDAEQAIFSSIAADEVTRAVDALPEEFRGAVVLSDVEDLSYGEIADVLGVPVGTVKSRIYRGRRLLQEALYDYAVEMGYVRPRASHE